MRTLRTGHWDIFLEEARKFHVDLLGLCETHLTNTETLVDKDYFTVLLSSRTDVGREGVGTLISPTSQLQHCLKSYDAVSSRIITTKFQLEDGVVNFIQVYAPTSSHSDQEAERMYDICSGENCSCDNCSAEGDNCSAIIAPRQKLRRYLLRRLLLRRQLLLR